jgi:Fic family protein
MRFCIPNTSISFIICSISYLHCFVNVIYKQSLSPEKQKELLSISLRKGIAATTAIEGNSLSEDEVKKIIEGNAQIPKSKAYQKTEIENVLRAYNEIVRQIRRPEIYEISVEQIKKDHADIMSNLGNDDITPGKIREHSVLVSRYRGAPAEDCEYLLSRLCTWLNGDWGFGEENSIIEAIFKAIMGHLYLAWIHPFADGNGRTARALELRILLASGVPMDAAHLLSNHYNETRKEYYEHLEEASSSAQGKPVQFIMYAVQGLVDALDGQIEIILNEQLRVTWMNYVHSRFGSESTSVKNRQKALLLEISKMDNPINISEIRMRLSDMLLKAYEDKTTRAFRRDINALLNMGLLKRDGAKIFPAKELMKAFLPVSKTRT